MIKNIIFDIAGVVVGPYDDYLCRWISEKENKNLEEVISVLGEIVYKAEEAQYDEYSSFEKVIKELNLTLKPQELVDKREKFTELNKDVVGLIQQLKNSYKILFATNNSAEEFARNFYKFNFKELFSAGYASYHLKVRKDKKDFFEKFIKLTKINPEESIFIDDSKKNLVFAKELGFTTIHFQNKEQLFQELIELKIRV